MPDKNTLALVKRGDQTLLYNNVSSEKCVLADALREASLEFSSDGRSRW